MLKYALNIVSMWFMNFPKDEITTKPPLIVQTQNGLVEGVTVQAAFNETVTAFLGIPFAKPPVGDLRYILKISFDPILN